MNRPSPQLVDSPTNPFSSRFVRPGALPYVFPPGATLETVARRLADNGMWGQIIGPHGTGKSTLLAALLAEWERAGERPVIHIELHDGQRRLSDEVWHAVASTHNAIVAVDGYEQLGAWSRWRLRRHCRRRNDGLVVTAHADVGLPTVWTTRADRQAAEAVVRRLLAGADVRIDPGEVEACFAARGGNLRDVLFDLYDLYEARRRDAAC